MTTPTPPPDSSPKRSAPKRQAKRDQPSARRDRRPRIRLQPARYVPMTPEQEAEAIAILAYILATAPRPTTPPPSQQPPDTADEHDEADPDDRD